MHVEDSRQPNLHVQDGAEPNLRPGRAEPNLRARNGTEPKLGRKGSAEPKLHPKGWPKPNLRAKNGTEPNLRPGRAEANPRAKSMYQATFIDRTARRHAQFDICRGAGHGRDIYIPRRLPSCVQRACIRPSCVERAGMVANSISRAGTNANDMDVEARAMDVIYIFGGEMYQRYICEADPTKISISETPPARLCAWSDMYGQYIWRAEATNIYNG